MKINRSPLFSQAVRKAQVLQSLFDCEILHQSAHKASHNNNASAQVLICPKSQSTGSLPLQSLSLPILRETSSVMFRLRL